MSGSSTASVGGAVEDLVDPGIRLGVIRDSERSIGEGAGGGRSCRIGSVLGGGGGESQHSNWGETRNVDSTMEKGRRERYARSAND